MDPAYSTPMYGVPTVHVPAGASTVAPTTSHAIMHDSHTTERSVAWIFGVLFLILVIGVAIAAALGYIPFFDSNYIDTAPVYIVPGKQAGLPWNFLTSTNAPWGKGELVGTAGNSNELICRDAAAKDAYSRQNGGQPNLWVLTIDNSCYVLKNDQTSAKEAPAVKFVSPPPNLGASQVFLSDSTPVTTKETYITTPFDASALTWTPPRPLSKAISVVQPSSPLYDSVPQTNGVDGKPITTEDQCSRLMLTSDAQRSSLLLTSPAPDSWGAWDNVAATCTLYRRTDKNQPPPDVLRYTTPANAGDRMYYMGSSAVFH